MSTESEMVERMARAMWREREKSLPAFTQRHVPDEIDHASGAWADMCALARAGLEALREPTEGMVDAPRGLIMHFNSQPNGNWTLGQHADSGGYGEGYAHLLTEQERTAPHFPKAHQAHLIWRAMLDAALTGRPGLAARNVGAEQPA